MVNISSINILEGSTHQDTSKCRVLKGTEKLIKQIFKSMSAPELLN